MNSDQIGIMGVFDRLDTLLEAIEGLSKIHIPIERVHSPAPNEQIQKKLGMKRSAIHFFALAGGLFGLVFAYFLCIATASVWELDVWGKPFTAWIPYSVIAYEWTLLAAVIASFFGVLILARKKLLDPPPLYDPRFTVDRFGIVVTCSRWERKYVLEIFSKAEKIDETDS